MKLDSSIQALSAETTWCLFEFLSAHRYLDPVCLRRFNLPILTAQRAQLRPTLQNNKRRRYTGKKIPVMHKQTFTNLIRIYVATRRQLKSLKGKWIW